MTTLNERLQRRPANRANVDAIKDEMRKDTEHYRLRNLREEAGLTQRELAQLLKVGQNRISQIEHGNLLNSRVSTLRDFAQATGGDIEIIVRLADGTSVPLSLD